MADRVFQGIEDKIIDQDDTRYEKVIERWAKFTKKQHRKKLIPLFITGLGVSKDGVNNIPDMHGIIDKLKKMFDEGEKYKQNHTEINNLLNLLKDPSKESKNDKKDRGTVARLLKAFQETDDLKNNIWKLLNKDWLLPRILDARPTSFHKLLADFYESFDAVNITLNFDGLLIREFEINRKTEKQKLEKAFSLPTKKECESFFLRLGSKENTVKEYLEIQTRGDILYVKCDAEGHYCPNKEKKHSLWAPIASYPRDETDHESEPKLNSAHFLTCPFCGEIGIPFLSFPGSYEKEDDMKEILETVWKYLAFRVGSVTVVGTSGEWDPRIIAFLGDLLSERDIPLLVVDLQLKKPEDEGSYKEFVSRNATYIVKELVNTRIHDAVAVGTSANKFMEDLTSRLLPKGVSKNEISIVHNEGETDDQYWVKIAVEANLEESINIDYSKLENEVRKKIKDKINKFAQLGLKSYWMGIKNTEIKKRYHTRFNHSIGVMKVGTYLYDNAINNAGLKENSFEKQFLRLAALLHDIGHLPFSHLIEDVFNELNWKPAGYKDHYSHVFQTDKEIEELFNDDEQRLKKQLEKTGYNVADIIKLVNGSFGVGYLDAIINSSIDADKIDYVFRDTHSTGRKTSLVPVQFLKDIVNGLSVTPEKYLSFSGVSAMTAVGLLRERQRLYRSLYLQPGIIILEGIVKLIIKTYFVHFISLNDDQIIKKMEPKNYDYPDLGDYKISYCVKELIGIFEEKKDGKDIELGIVECMFERIKKEKHNIINQRFLENTGKGFSAIRDTKDEGQLKELEQKVAHKQLKGKEEKIREIARDVMFRMPADVIIETIKSPQFLSSAESRKEKERSDGTKTFSDCILVPKKDYNAWNTNDEDSGLNLPPIPVQTCH